MFGGIGPWHAWQLFGSICFSRPSISTAMACIQVGVGVARVLESALAGTGDALAGIALADLRSRLAVAQEKLDKSNAKAAKAKAAAEKKAVAAERVVLKRDARKAKLKKDREARKVKAKRGKRTAARKADPIGERSKMRSQKAEYKRKKVA
jgi:hypothetical protein